MFHLVARTPNRRLLFRTWAEARSLWDAVIRVTHGRIALVLMPDHLHLIHPRDVRLELAAGLAGYTHARNQRRGERGPLFKRLPKAESIVGAEKLRRHVRYVHLNPCRRHLARDPLAWPFSTHRDACGLALPAHVERVRDAPGFHRCVSSDPTVAVDGTELPGVVRGCDDPAVVLTAVSAVTRTPVAGLFRRGHGRTLFLRAAVDLCPQAGMTAIGACVGVGRHAAARASDGVVDPSVKVIARVLGDPRFNVLHDGPVRFGSRYR